MWFASVWHYGVMTSQTPPSKPSKFKVVIYISGFTFFCCVSFFAAVFFVAMTNRPAVDGLTIFETAYSPDGKLKAVVFASPKRPEVKNVSVLSVKGDPEKHRGGNVFSEACTQVSAKWKDNQSLVIYGDGVIAEDVESKSFIAFDRGVEIDIRELKGK